MWLDLIDELTSGDALRRETAVARLAVIGPRAMTRLIAVAGDPAAATDVRIGALEALGAIGDGRASSVATAAAADADDRIAVAAIAVLGQIARERDARATRAFDRLAALVLAPDAGTDRRLAALSALEGQPEKLLKPLYAALAKDPASRVVARVTRRQAGAVEPLDTLVARGLPDDPDIVAAVARDDGARSSVTTLKRVVDAARLKEGRAATVEARAKWMAVRGVAHQHLAERGSRLALYDLREALADVKGPLPVGFLSAAAAIGDTACLESLAAAWLGAAPDDRWWREHLAEAFRAIVVREGLTRRHPMLKKILERWPAAGLLVASAPLRASKR